MFEKILDTLKYGSGHTKRKLYLLAGAFLVGIVLMIAAFALSNFVLGLVGFVVLLIDGLSILNTSFDQKTVEVASKERVNWFRRFIIHKAGSSKKKEEGKTEEDMYKEEDDGPGALEWIPSGDKNPLTQYNKKNLKKLFIKYKVKKHHVPVMIDYCQAERIMQSPAYMWNDATYLYFLVLQETPRLIKSPLSDSDVILIRRGVAARPMEEYLEMSESSSTSLVSLIFGKLLPNYYEVDGNPYKKETRKNLYSAAPGIWCTSASVKNMLKILPDHFILEDGKTEEESIFYQEIYNARLMFWDGIYSGQEYKEKVLAILNELIQIEISEETVNEYVNALLMKGLIPREYADYVIQKRKVRKKS